MRLIDADAVPQEFWEYEFDGKWRGCTIKDLLDSQPTIQPEPHWIPMTERLPETYESVLVWSNGYICKDMIVCPYDDKIWYRCGKIEDDDYWMPLSCLPEPYKEVTE